jgi:hypothetical protein
MAAVGATATQSAKQAPGLQISPAGSDGLLLKLSGAWTLGNPLPSPSDFKDALGTGESVRRIAFDTAGITDWDSGLLTFLLKIESQAGERHIEVEPEGLPEGVRRLLALAAAVPPKATHKGEKPRNPIAVLGEQSRAFYDDAMRDAQQLVERVNNRIEPLMAELEGAAEAARKAMLQAESTLALEEGVPGELAANINETSRAATSAFNQARKTLALTEGEPGRIASDLRATLAKTQTTLDLVNGVLDEGSPFRQDLSILMQELGAAARSLRVMADYLERHPEALLKGKPQY